ncbi:MAG: 2-phospho-L-lactate guanylyltransferase [Paracoccaceae bacterium]|nr:2-phospho-L-lactate guanylyltransferase [Paracoccaceae bacterium]
MGNKNLIIVPMKDPRRSKSRLKGCLSDLDRELLVLKLFNQTLDRLEKALNDLEVEFEVRVVTESEKIEDICLSHNIRTINSGEPKSLSLHLDYAARQAAKLKFSSLCIIPADLADPKIEDFKKLLSFPIVSGEVVMCPANDLGTNALFVSPPNAFGFAYGTKSFLKHVKLAETANVRPVILPLDSIKVDVDTSEDLENLLLKCPTFIKNVGMNE